MSQNLAALYSSKESKYDPLKLHSQTDATHLMKKPADTAEFKNKILECNYNTEEAGAMSKNSNFKLQSKNSKPNQSLSTRPTKFWTDDQV